MIIKLLKIIYHFLQDSKFIIFNVISSFKLKPFASSELNGITYRAMRRKEIYCINELHKEAFSDTDISKRNTFLWWFLSKKFVFVATEGNHIVGYITFYFNYKDIENKTIHAAEMAVSKNMRGKKIGYNLRFFSKKNLENSHLIGMTTSISQNNMPSLVTAYKLGFQSTEEYFDQIMNEKRYYLVCKFKEKQ